MSRVGALYFEVSNKPFYRAAKIVRHFLILILETRSCICGTELFVLNIQLYFT